MRPVGGGDGAARGGGDGVRPGRRPRRRRGRRQPLEIRLPVKAGPQTIEVTFIKRSSADVDDLVQRFDATTGDLQTGVQFGYTTVPHLSGVEIVGPYYDHRPRRHAEPARIFVCRPASAPRRAGVRAADSLDAGPPRPATPGHRQ